MRVLWRKGKAALAVLLALCIVFSGPDLMVLAGSSEPAEASGLDLSEGLTDQASAAVNLADSLVPIDSEDAVGMDSADGTMEEAPDSTPEGGGAGTGTLDKSDADEGTDGTDESDADESTDGTDESDADESTDGTDESDADEGTDGTDESDADESTDGTDESDADEGTDGTDESDADEGTDGTDESDADEGTDGTDEPDEDEETDGTDESDADSDEEADGDGKLPEMPEGSIDTEKVDYIEEWVDIDPTETSADSWGFFSSRATGGVQLAPGNHEKWIDRIVIPADASYARTLYDLMVEASDNDGVEDIFIDDSFRQGDQKKALFSGKYTTKAEYESKFSEVQGYVRAVFDAFDRDYPEVFWLTGTSQVGYSGKSTEVGGQITYEITFYVDFSKIRQSNYQNASTIKADINVRERQISAIRNTVSGKDAVEKIKGFDTWLTMHNEYNTIVGGNQGDGPASAYECLSALKGSIGTSGPVCEGYARALKILCDREGIPCVLVDGQAGGPHMWNNVQVGGAWYAVDVTWDDPSGGNSGAVSGYENQDWLLVGSATVIDGKAFSQSHVVQNHASQGGLYFTNGPVLSAEAYVQKPAPTVTFAQAVQSVVYSGAAAVVTPPTVTVGGTAVSSPAIAYSYRSGNAGAFTEGLPVDAGTYEVKAKVAAGADHSAAESTNTLTLTITKAPLTVTALDQTCESGESISGDVSQVKCEGLKGSDKLTGCRISVEGSHVDVGTYDIAVGNAEIAQNGRNVTGNYQITYVQGKLTVIKAACTDKTNRSQSIAKGDGNFEKPSFVDKKGNAVNGTVSYEYEGATYDYAGLVQKLSQAGDGVKGKFTYQFKPESGNYAVPAKGTISFTIVKISFTVNGAEATAANAVAFSATPVYGDTWEQIVKLQSGLTANFKDGQDSQASHFALNLSGPVRQAGDVAYRVLYSGTIAGTQFSNVVVCEGTVNVRKAPLTITVNNHEITYGETPSDSGVTYDGFRNGDSASELTGTLRYSYGDYAGNAGEYAMTASGLSSSNYDITFKPGRLIVAKRILDVEWQGAATVTYDGTEHTIMAALAAGSTIVNGDDVRIVCTGNKGTSAGTYTATATVNSPNYAVSEGTRTKALVIEPRKLAFTWSGEFKTTYDGKKHGVTAALDESSLVAGDKVEFTCAGTEGVDAGTYTARVATVSNPNYTITGSDTAVKEWVIERKGIEDAKVVLDEEQLTYNGATHINAGDYTLTVTGIGNYAGKVELSYSIAKADAPINKPEPEETVVVTKAEGLGNIPLPAEWVWEDPEVELIPGGTVEVWAVVGNRDNYNIPEDDKDFRVKYQVSKLPELVAAATDTSYTIGAGSGATIKSTGALSEFKRVEVDGKVVDASNYTLKEGSTILTFKKEYLDSLSVGTHKVELFYTVGSVPVNLTVSKKTVNPPAGNPAPPQNPANGSGSSEVSDEAVGTAAAILSPKTDDGSMVSLYWLIALASLAGACACAGKAWGRNRKSSR